MTNINGNIKTVATDSTHEIKNKNEVAKWKHYKVSISNNQLNKVINRKDAFDSINVARVKGDTAVELKNELARLQQKDANFLQHLGENAEIAALPYYQDISRVNAINNSNWEQCTELCQQLETALKADKNFASAKFYQDKGKIVDKKTGFTAFIIKNEDKKDVRIVFGGTTSGKHAGGLLKRQYKNIRSTANQWGANLKNIFTKTPKSYTQAQLLTSKLADLLDSSYKLTLSGHSKGAAEAVFASLMQPVPCETICFSSAELGEASLEKIKENNDNNINKANEYISHYFIKGDIIPNASKYFSSVHKIGKFYKIPSKSKMSTPIDRHDKFFKHIHNFVAKNTIL